LAFFASWREEKLGLSQSREDAKNSRKQAKEEYRRIRKKRNEKLESLAIFASWREKGNAASHGGAFSFYRTGVSREECLLQPPLTLPGA